MRSPLAATLLAAALLTCPRAPLHAQDQLPGQPQQQDIQDDPLDNLPQLSAEAAFARDDEINKPTTKALERKVAHTDISSTFEDALAGLAKSAGFKISVNWKALEDAGIKKDAPISVSFSGQPVRKVLTEILNEAGGSTAAIRFTVDDNQVIVSTADDLTSQKYQTIRVYDITFVFSDAEATEANITSLVDTLQTVVAPDTWREKGGTIGSIREFNGKLIIAQTNDNHRAIVQILKQIKSDHLDRTRAYDVHDILQPAAADVKSPEQKSRDAAALLKAIETNCGRGTWREDGGTECSAAYFDGRLYVTAPPGVHEEIDHLLKLMRKK
jgi:hypothetical protein